MAFLYRSTCFQFSEDLDVGEELTNKVYIRDHDCVDHIEKLYYSSGLKNQPIYTVPSTSTDGMMMM